MTKGKTMLEIFEGLRSEYVRLRKEVIEFEDIFASKESIDSFEKLLSEQVDANHELITFLNHADKKELIEIILEYVVGEKSPDYIKMEVPNEG